MTRARFLAIFVITFAGSALPALAAAKEKSPVQDTSAAPADQREEAASPANAQGASDAGGQTESTVPNQLPRNASAAIVRASAAYEYGDMNQVVEAARPVTEGLLPASREEQAQAFRLLGMGLYLTNRPLGAETAFTELLSKDPKARLDPTSTRPELVAFFENLRRQHLTRQRSTRKVYWNFIPPVGQFQNDDNVKGWLVLGVGVASLATATTSMVLLNKWHRTDDTFPGHENTAPTLKTVNWISCGVLAAVYIYGVFDGLVGYNKPLDDGKPSVSLRVLPGSAGLGFTF
jgi:hypothetical protein